MSKPFPTSNNVVLRQLNSDPRRTTDEELAAGPEKPGVGSMPSQIPPAFNVPVMGSWEDPQQLRREMPDAEDFPIDALGSILSSMATSMVEIVKCPGALPAQALSAAENLVTQPHANIEIDGRVSPISEFFVSVAVSGERKSQVDRDALSPIIKRQTDLLKEAPPLHQEYKDRAPRFEKARESILDQDLSGQEEIERIAVLGPKPIQPINPIMIVEEPTYEGIVKFWENNGNPSIGLFNDEGGQWLAGHGMSKEKQMATVAALSHLWDGKPLTRCRAGDGTFVLPGRRMSFHLMVQPAVSDLLFGNKMFIDQGINSRILPAYPKSTIGGRMYNDSVLRETPAFKAYFARMMSILETPFPLADGTITELEPRIIMMSQKAKARWIRFHDHTEKLAENGGPLAPVRGLALKAPEHCVRLSAQSALLENIDAGEIGIMYVEGAIRRVEFYLGEALRISTSSGGNPDLIVAEDLLRWSRARAHDGLIYPGMIMNGGPNAIRSKAVLERITGILLDHGWMRPGTSGTIIEGKRRRVVYEVNMGIDI